MQISLYDNKGISSPISIGARQVVNNEQNFVNVVKEWPTTALPKGQRGRWKIRIREREKKNLFFCVTFYYCVCESPIVVQVVKSLILFYFFARNLLSKKVQQSSPMRRKGSELLLQFWTFKNDYQVKCRKQTKKTQKKVFAFRRNCVTLVKEIDSKQSKQQPLE